MAVSRKDVRVSSRVFKQVLIASSALAVLSTAAQGQSDSAGPTTPWEYGEGQELMFSSWREGRRFWMDYYWDTEGRFCAHQRYTTYPDGVVQTNGNRSAAPNSMCNRDYLGNFTPGRAPWDRTGRSAASSAHVAQGRGFFDDVFGNSGVQSVIKFLGAQTPLTSRQSANQFSLTDRRLAPANPAGLTRISGNDVYGAMGTVDTSNQFSNVARLEITIGAGSGTCTGTLINRRQILTAAHCLDVPGFSPDDIDSITIHLGPDGQSLSYSVMAATMHEDWDPLTFEGDVAVLTLDMAALDADPVVLEGSDAANTVLGSSVIAVGHGFVGTGATGFVGSDGFRRWGTNELDAIGTRYDFYLNAYGIVLSDNERDNGPDMLFFDFDGGAAPNLIGGTATEREVATMPGDSGGPLFVETASGLVQIGLLTGGANLYGPIGGFGDVSWYQPVAKYVDWIDGLDPFYEAHTAGSDGYWHDETHWTLGEIPENDQVDPGELVILTDVYYAPVLWEVFLDTANTTRVQQEELVDTVYLTNNARLIIEEIGSLNADAGLGIESGEVIVEGLLEAQQLQLNGGRMHITESGAYLDHSPYFALGTWQNGAELIVDGLFLADEFLQTGGRTYVGETGAMADFNGAVIAGGAFELDGLYFSGNFGVVEAYVEIGETGYLYDELGSTVAVNGLFFVDGEVDTLDFLLIESTLGGDGLIRAPFGVFQAGGVLEMYDGERVGQSLDIDGDYFLIDGLANFGIGANGVDQIRVSGMADLTGDIVFNFHDGFAPLRNQRFTFATADGGLSTSLTLLNADPSPVLSFNLGNTGTEGFVSVDAEAYTSFAQSEQQLAVASALDTAMGQDVPEGALAELAMALDYLPSNEAIQSALQTANPSDTFVTDRVMQGMSRALGAIVSDRSQVFASGRHGGVTRRADASAGIQMASSDPSAAELLAAVQMATGQSTPHQPQGMNDETALYFTVEAQRGDTDLANGSMDIEGSYVFAGLDHQVSEHWLLGGNIGFASYNAGRGIDHVRSEAVSAAAYAAFSHGRLYGSAYAGIAQADHDMTRAITLGPNTSLALGETQSDQWSMGIEGGYNFGSANAQFGPVFRLRHGEADIDGYSERNAGAFSATLDARTADMSLLGAGARGLFEQETRFGAVHYLAELTWEQDVSEGEGAVSASLAGAPSAVFPVTTPGHDDGWASLTLGVSLQASERVAFSARYRGDFERETDADNALSLAMSWRF